MKKALAISSMLLAGGIGLTFANPASAALLSFTVEGGPKGGNACPGFFEDLGVSGGEEIDRCDVGFGLDEPVGISAAIAKYDVAEDDDGDDGDWSIATAFSTFDGSEISGLTDTKTGNWTYTPDDNHDPLIKYWAAKGGTGFTLFWEVDQQAIDDGICDVDNPYSSDCLAQAMAVNSGSWDTRPDSNAGGPGLSNMVFFNSKPGNGGDPDPEPVPEPAAMLGLMGVGAGIVLNRRKKAQQA